MSNTTIYPESSFNQDPEIWENLKEAIAKTSGFECWQQENNIDNKVNKTNLDRLVRSYLRETLETLAY